MTNQIVLAQPIATAVKPKPTKKEVVDALVQLKLRENDQKNKERDAKMAKLKKQIDIKAKRFITRNKGKTQVQVRVRTWNYKPTVEVEFEVDWESTPEDLQALLVEYKKLSNEGYCIDEKKLRRQIMEGMQMISPAGDRVQALLTDPQSKKALEAILKEIE